MKNRKIREIIKRKNKRPIVCLTAYSKTIAEILDKYCDIVLVGDSLGMVLYGMESTREVTLDMIINHAKSVKKGISKSVLVIDMPYQTYRNKKEAYKNAKKIIKSTKCDALKLEGGKKIINVIKYLIKKNYLKKTKLLNKYNKFYYDKNNPAVNDQEYDQLKKDLLKIAPEILKFSKPVWKKLDEYKSKHKKILFEGAQGILLDVDHGTYPFVTSSNTVASSAATGSGCGPNTINYVLGITKAYTTRVGEGPFPTELKDKTGELLGVRGKEFGTVTSRKRRCGWFDGVLVRQSIKISGINGIALTKLDVLDELNEIKMCVKYEINGKEIDYLPAAVDDQLKVKPFYKTFPGWKTSTKGIRNLEDLPNNAKIYIHAIEDFIGAKIASISTSPEREDTILLKNPFGN